MTRRLSLLLVLTVFGCSRSTTTPPSGSDVTLDVMVARVSGAPIVRAELRNDQPVAIRHGVGCSYWGPGMRLFFLDDNGDKLLLDGGVGPLCPDGIAVLQSGGRLDAARQLEGTLYTEEGHPVPMQPGKYTAVVSFGWRSVEDPANGPWQDLEKRVEFRWPVLQ